MSDRPRSAPPSHPFLEDAEKIPAPAVNPLGAHASGPLSRAAPLPAETAALLDKFSEEAFAVSVELENLTRLLTLFAANTDRGMYRLLATTIVYRMERASQRAFRLSVEALPRL